MKLPLNKLAPRFAAYVWTLFFLWVCYELYYRIGRLLVAVIAEIVFNATG